MINGTRHRLTVEINRQTRLAADIARTQVEISTGKKILAPSDDPTASARISEFARAQANEAAWVRNLESAAALSDRADTALSAVASGLTRAKELIIAAANGTLSADNRATIAAELRGIAADITTLADSRDPRGEALFRTGAPLEIPVHAGGTIAPVASRAAIFGAVTTPSGVFDLATILSDAADAVVEPDDATRAAAADVSLDALDAAVNHIAAARGDQGVRASRIDNLREQLELSSLQLDEQRSGLESTNVTEAIARLQSKQLTLQAAQAVFARVNQNSLFDLLR